ncbi:MFS transporter [bacterium]|nr:MAG: MFS transporter [bacterium]
MSRVIFGWAFGAVFFQLSAGAVYAAFARQLGATEAVFGFLSGVYQLMGWVQIPAARLLEGSVGARAMMLTAGLICRLMWVLAAMLPLLNRVFPEVVTRSAMLPMFIGCLVLSSIGQAFTGPSFFAWMSALVPDRVGPTFWARRHQVGTVVAIFAVLIGGGIADRAGLIKEWSNGEITPLLTYSLLLTVAALCGVMDIAAFIGVKEPPSAGPKIKQPPFLASMRIPLRERAVRNYLIFTIFGMMGFASTGPLLWLFCLEHLEFDKTQTGFLLTICPLLGVACSAKWWGGIAKIHGTRPMVRFASVGLIIVPLCWLFALPESKVGLAIMLFGSGILVTAYEISNLNFMTRACPHLARPTLVALFSICAGMTFALTSWGCGIAAEQLSFWHMEIAGIEFANFHLIFAFSLLPRTINALFLAPRLEDNSASSTREAMSEVGASLAAAFGPRFTRYFEAREE